jgi:hypothetical protein
MTIRRLAIVLKRRLNLGRRLACDPHVAGTEKQRQQKRHKSEQYKSPIAAVTLSPPDGADTRYQHRRDCG